MLQTNGGWKPRFYTIAAGQAISLLGSSAVQFSLIWWLASKTGSPMVMSMAGLAGFLPLMFVSPFAGVWVDRLKLKRVLIFADLFIALCAALFAVAASIGEPSIWLAFCMLFCRALGSAFHTPAMQKTVPMLVPETELMRANSVSQFLQSGAYMLGPVIGSALYAALPLETIMLTDVAGAVIACVSVALVEIPNPAREQAGAPHMFREMLEGAKVLLSQRKLFVVTIMATICMMAYLPLSSLFPLMSSQHFGGTEWHGGIAEFAYAAGMLGSAALLGAKGEIKRKYLAMHLGLLVLGGTSLLCGLLPGQLSWFWAFAVLCALMGGGGNLYSVPYTVHVQQTIPPEAMGRVFSLIGSLMSFSMPIGLLIAGPVAERVGVGAWFLIAGAATLLIGAASLLITGRMREEAPEQ